MGGCNRDRREPEPKVENSWENLSILVKFCLKKKILAMFLAKTEPGKFRSSLWKGTLKEAGEEKSQENGRKWFSFRILVGNRL